jgi:Ser/Thr protein kinase RdoA (MazF antagonist)
METATVEFIDRVCALFDLAGPSGISPLPGNANRLWGIDCTPGIFVVKEFRYTTHDSLWLAAVREAAEFEFLLWQRRTVPMPEPIRSPDGVLIPVIAGSRGGPAAIRVHRWLSGAPIANPGCVPTAATAGALLSIIQAFGRGFRVSPTGALHWWRWDPKGILARLEGAGLIATRLAEKGRLALADANRLINAGEKTPGLWSFSHFDHRPENSLWLGNEIAVLDWDEAAPCHPRLEAVESAVRWATRSNGTICPDAFAAFVAGYRKIGADMSRLQPSDFGKLVASMVGWFEYLGRRALKEFGDTAEDVTAAQTEAASTLDSLSDTLIAIREMCEW